MEPTWNQLEANLRSGACPRMEGFSEEANLSQHGPTWVNLEPIWANMTPTWANFEPTWLQVGPILPQKSKLEAMLKLSYITIGKQKKTTYQDTQSYLTWQCTIPGPVECVECLSKCRFACKGLNAEMQLVYCNHYVCWLWQKHWRQCTVQWFC